MKLQQLAIMGLLITLFNGCSSDDEPDPNDPNNPGGGSGGKVTITGTSPDYTFWGDELTITGTGFSEVKSENVVTFVNSYPSNPGLKLTSKEGDIEIVSASKTKLVIRVPYLTEEKSDHTITMGEDFANIAVAVGEAKDTSDVVKFLGLPRVGTFEYHYGWYDLGKVARSGDSVLLGGGFYGSKLYAGEAHLKAAGVYDKLRLRVDGKYVPIKYRKLGGTINGWGLYLPSNEFSVVNCSEGANGWGDRALTFEFYVEGTDKKSLRELYVTYLPEFEVTDYSGPTTVSKSAGGVPFWTVKGEDMYYEKARFTPNCVGLTAVEEGIATPGTIHSEYTVSIPLSLMEPGCTYGIQLVTACGGLKHIGYVAIAP